MHRTKSSSTQRVNSRRRFNRIVGTGLVAIPLLAVKDSFNNFVYASEVVDPDSPQASALQYLQSSDTEGQRCSNCTLYQGLANKPTGPCPLFAGKHVSASGWCSAWVPTG